MTLYKAAYRLCIASVRIRYFVCPFPVMSSWHFQIELRSENQQCGLVHRKMNKWIIFYEQFIALDFTFSEYMKLGKTPTNFLIY
jgi:hypothetical protein